MKIRILLLLVIGIFECTFSFGQGTLAYQWKANSFYKFKAVQNDKIKMGGGMMGMMAMSGDMEFKTESSFTLRIDQVFPNGSAKGSFFVTAFRVTDTKGNTLASLQNLPKNAIEADFTVDKRGNFTFTEAPILVCREGNTMLVSMKIEKGEMAASSEVDGERVTLFAEFNPKKGTLKAGYTETTISKPKPKPVVIKEDDETIDLLPTDFLDFLSLPEGRISAGSHVKTRMYDTEITQTVEDFTNNVAKLNIEIKSALNSRKFEKDAKKMAGDDDQDDMGMDMPDDMGGMNPGGGTPDMGQEMEGDIKLTFDNGKGMFQEMTGTIDSKTKMMGMEVSSVSTVKMVPVP